MDSGVYDVHTWKGVATMTGENDTPRKKAASEALGVWIAIGAGVGVALGTVLDNLGLGLALGVALGVVIGVILQSRASKGGTGSRS